MYRQRAYRILIGGGGTGGHVFPAIAIADALKERRPEAEFLFVGALGKLEMEKVPEAGYTIEGLPVAGFQRRITFKNLTFFYKLIISMLRSRKIIRQFHPDVAIGVGGYASGPILRAAARKGIPILIQEQNSYAGVTNRLLGRSARTVCVAYEGMERYFPAQKIVITGNPVRQQVIRSQGDPRRSMEEFELEEGKKICLIVGGSLGARTLNTCFLEGMDKMDRKDLQVLWQCGRFYYDDVEQKVKASGKKNIRVMPFISRMDLAYEAADVVVSRAGALSISELCLVGKPAILVPSPNVAEDHQTHNAEALVEKKAALMVSDADAPKKLVDLMLGLMENDQLREELSSNISQLGLPDAAQRIAAEVLKIMEEE